MAVNLVAFDLYGTLLDIGCLRDVLEEYTSMPDAMVQAWRTRQLQLSNSATSAGRYVDFDRITLLALHEIAPRFVAKLAPSDQKRLVDAWAALPAFPEVQSVLHILMKQLIPLAVITNAVASTAQNALQHAGIDAYFTSVYSADAVGVFKPNARVYDEVLQLGVEKDEILFVSSNDWDATGARQAGYRTVWVHRRRGGLTPRPERSIADLNELPGLLSER